MKLRNLMLLIALSGLVTAPAFAATRDYKARADLVITSPSALGGCTIFFAGNIQRQPVLSIDSVTGCEVGISPWAVGSGSSTQLEDNGISIATPPVLNFQITQSALTQEFSCASTSAFGTGLPIVPGCMVYIETDTVTFGAAAGAIPADALVADSSVYPGGWRIEWPSFTNAVQDELGLGTYCEAHCVPALNTGGVCSAAEDDLIEGTGVDASYCARFLGYVQADWIDGPGLQNFFDPLTVPDWQMAADFSQFQVGGTTEPATANPDSYQIFNNTLLGDLVRGNILNTVGYDVNATTAVPLAPLAGLGALGGSLMFMGYRVIRRRK